MQDQGPKNLEVYTYADWDSACEAIDKADWDSIIMTENVDDAWKAWLQQLMQFMSIMNQFIPNCSLQNIRQNLPWLTKSRSLIKSIKKRNLLYKRAKKSGSFISYKLAAIRL